MEKILRDSYNIQKEIDCKLGKLLKNSNEIKKLLKEKLAEIIQQLTDVNTKLESIKEDTTQLVEDNKIIIRHLEKIEENTDPTEIIRLLKLAIKGINDNTVSIVEALGENHEELLKLVESNNNILTSLNALKDLVDTKLKSIEDLLGDIKNGQVKAVELKGCVKSTNRLNLYDEYDTPWKKIQYAEAKKLGLFGISLNFPKGDSKKNAYFFTGDNSIILKPKNIADSDIDINTFKEKVKNFVISLNTGITLKDIKEIKVDIENRKYSIITFKRLNTIGFRIGLNNSFNYSSMSIQNEKIEPATLVKFFDRDDNEIREHRKCYIDGEELTTNYEFSLDCEKFYHRETLKKLSEISTNTANNQLEGVLDNLSDIKTLLTNIDNHTSEKLNTLIDRANTQITQHDNLQNLHNRVYAKNLEKLQLLKDIKELLRNQDNGGGTTNTNNNDIIAELQKIILNQQQIIKNTDKQNVVSVTDIEREYWFKYIVSKKDYSSSHFHSIYYTYEDFVEMIYGHNIPALVLWNNIKIHSYNLSFTTTINYLKQNGLTITDNVTNETATVRYFDLNEDNKRSSEENIQEEVEKILHKSGLDAQFLLKRDGDNVKMIITIFNELNYNNDTYHSFLKERFSTNTGVGFATSYVKKIPYHVKSFYNKNGEEIISKREVRLFGVLLRNYYLLS